MSSLSLPRQMDFLHYRTEALRAQLTCLLVVTILHFFVRCNQYLIGAIQWKAAIFACGSLSFFVLVVWTLRNYLDLNIDENEKPQALKNAMISKIVGVLLICSFSLVVSIGYMEYHDMPDKWTTITKGRHMLVAQTAIVIAGLSLSRAKVWVVAGTAVLLHFLLMVLSVETEKIEVTKSMRLASMSPALNLAWEFRSIVTVLITAYATTTFCRLYEGMLVDVQNRKLGN